MVKVTFLIGEGCLFSCVSSLLDAFTIADAWNRALHQNTTEPLFQTQTVTTDGMPVNTNGGIQICPDRSIYDVEQTDLIIIPGFLPNVEPVGKALDDMLSFLDNHYSQNTNLAAVCTGTFVLAETGLLTGKTATTNWQYANLFKRRHPKVHLEFNHVVTHDSGLVCTGAATAIFNLVLYILETYVSSELAYACAKALLVDPNRASQAPYFVFNAHQNHRDKEVLKAQKWMEEHYTENIAIDDIADYVSISSRHFKRRFKRATGESPLGYLQSMRIDAAKKKLETTLDNINEITFQIGYEDSSAFRRLFKKTTGISPREYRDKFSRLKTA